MYYYLEGKEVKPFHMDRGNAEDYVAWSKLVYGRDTEDVDNRRVALDKLEIDGEEVMISTVFLGIDHSFGGGIPMLFETMIFGGKNNEYQDRCSTYAEAEEMHARAVKIAKGELPND